MGYHSGVSSKDSENIFQQHPETMSRLWKNHTKQMDDSTVDPDLQNKRKRNLGRKGINLEYLHMALKEIPIKIETASRAVATALGVLKSTQLNNLKILGLRTSSRCLKPFLLAPGKKARLEWALQRVRDSADGAHKIHHLFRRPRPP